MHVSFNTEMPIIVEKNYLTMLWIRTLFWGILVYRMPNISGVISNYFWRGQLPKSPRKSVVGFIPQPDRIQHPKLALSLNSELNILQARALGPQ